jgi:hypothetical protein
VLAKSNGSCVLTPDKIIGPMRKTQFGPGAALEIDVVGGSAYVINATSMPKRSFLSAAPHQ